MDTRPIIVFDSGIGGQSIYRPLCQKLPRHNIVYFSDPANFPYGDKSQAWLNKRFLELSVQFALLDPSLVVLACNSATTNSVKVIREQLNCPVVGVEPVIKPLSKYQNSLALMTQSAASSESTKRLLEKYGQHVQIYVPHGLAVAIEYNDYDQVKKSISQIKRIVQDKNIQAVGLSCTHYPLIINMLVDAMPGIDFIDPAKGVVTEVCRVLKLT